MTNAENKPVQTYTPINADAVTSSIESHKQKEIYAANPNTNPAYTNEELEQKLIAAGIDPASIHEFYFRGGYTQDRDLAIANGGSGDPVSFYAPGVWYMYDGKPRDVKEGDSGADEALLSDGGYAYIQYCKEMYAKCQAAGDREGMDYWHSEAERTRARAGYSGGTDGSDYITLGYLGVNKVGDASQGASAGGGSGASFNAGTSSDLKSLLDAWQQAAMHQSNGQIDYAVAKAVADLERALADAQPQFKEQAESVDRDARQAMDNSALYAEMRGDKGGIGQEQYNSIQNTQAQNHLAVQQAQTKLATDTQRQIADLRAQGEFEKANAALEITQNYLAQLISLEQWAAEYNLSVAQFQASLQQWEAEYNLSMQQLQTSQNQWQAEFDYAKQLNSQNQLAGMGEALLSAGIPLTDEQLKAMGITGEQASQLLIQQQLAAAQKGNGSVPPAVTLANVDLDSAYDYLYSNKLTSDSSKEAIASMLIANGIPEDVAKQIAPLYKDLGYAQAEERYNNNNPLEATAPSVGMNPDYFKKEMMSLMTYLGHGKLDNLESRVNYLWPLLSEEQRKQLETMLDKYGIALG